MVSSAMEHQLGVFRYLSTTYVKTNANKIVHDLGARTRASLEGRAAFHVCLSSRSYCSRCRWHMHLTNHSYFDHREKKTNTPNWSPCWEGNGTGSRVFGLNLWTVHKATQFWSEVQFPHRINNTIIQAKCNRVLLFMTVWALYLALYCTEGVLTLTVKRRQNLWCLVSNVWLVIRLNKFQPATEFPSLWKKSTV